MLTVNKVNDKIFTIQRDDKEPKIFAEPFAATADGNTITLKSQIRRTEYRCQLDQLVVDGQAFSSSGDAIVALSFLGNFKRGGSSPSPTPTDPIPLTELPIGYNLRGKKIIFTEINRPTGGFSMDSESALFAGVISDPPVDPAVMIMFAPGLGGTIAEIHCVATSQQGGIVPYGNGRWNLDSLEFQIPDDADYKVIDNASNPIASAFLPLPAHTGDNWGFDFAFVTN